MCGQFSFLPSRSLKIFTHVTHKQRKATAFQTKPVYRFATDCDRLNRRLHQVLYDISPYILSSCIQSTKWKNANRKVESQGKLSAAGPPHQGGRGSKGEVLWRDTAVRPAESTRIHRLQAGPRASETLRQYTTYNTHKSGKPEKREIQKKMFPSILFLRIAGVLPTAISGIWISYWRGWYQAISQPVDTWNVHLPSPGP